MSASFPSSWRDPRYLATVVGVLSIGVLVFYAALVDGPPTVGTVVFVALVVILPMSLVYELADRLDS